MSGYQPTDATSRPDPPPPPGAGVVPVLSDPIHGELGQTLGRFLDPVRAHALAQAVRLYPYGGVPREEPIDQVMRVAETFESWLTRDEEA
jgi:hypothetical protein